MHDFIFADGAESTGRTFVCHTAESGLGQQHGVAEGEGQDDVDDEKGAAAVFGGQIGKTPDVSQSHRGTGCGQNIAEMT